MRPPQESVGEDDLTGIMQPRSLLGAVQANRILPAAGRPASLVPVSRRPAIVRSPASGRPPPSSARFAADMDEPYEDEEGRTVVRGSPAVAAPVPASKVTPDSNRSGRGQSLLGSAPPADLLADSIDRTEAITRHEGNSVRGFFPRVDAGAGPRGGLLEGPPSYPPAVGPYSQPPSSRRLLDGGHPRSAPAHVSPPRGVPAAPGSAPAHFMTPQAPYADPPGTSVTAGHLVTGRPAASWAAALLACGLFVGVVAVAVMQSSDAVADTTASFVDPARASRARAANGGSPGAQPVLGADPAAPAPPAGLLGAPTPSASSAGGAEPTPTTSPTTHAHPAQPTATPSAPNTVSGFAPVAVAPSAAAKRPTSTWKPPAPAAPAAPKVAAKADEEAPKTAAKAPPAKSKKAEPDDETKKALEALQKAQLESASSF